jgi:hypothetical protein
MILLFIAIYLPGYVLCYFVFKWSVMYDIPKIGYWTLSDRLTALVFALLSWCGILVGLFGLLLYKLFKNVDTNKPVKW